MNINQKYRDNTPSKEKIKQEEEEKQKRPIQISYIHI
jgi:hypothetical protein